MTNSACSLLESLPAEVLEMILLESLNVNLPRASPAIGIALSPPSPSLKLEFVHVYFRRDFRLAQFCLIGNEVPPHEKEGWEEHTRAQAYLLQWRWMTWDVVRT